MRRSISRAGARTPRLSRRAARRPGAAVYGGDAPATRGREAITQSYRDIVILYSDGTPRTRHLITNAIVEVDDGEKTAHAQSYFTAFQAVDGARTG